jgi:hypothetical protein
MQYNIEGKLQRCEGTEDVNLFELSPLRFVDQLVCSRG